MSLGAKLFITACVAELFFYGICKSEEEGGVLKGLRILSTLGIFASGFYWLWS